ncbi:hypothetical protein CYMTET_52064, partial [Cymbomonas tetramitiformis]
QLDPIWHTVSKRMKQMVYDLRTLRKLAGYLLRYDAITFLQYLETLRASETVNSVWLYATAASDIFEHAKRRVYLLHRANASAADRKRKRAEAPAAGSEVGRSELEAVLEPMPKWALLRDILREIKEELRQQGEQPGGSGAPQVCDVVLVSKDLATGQQLLRVIAEGEEEVMNAKFHKYLAHRAELQQKRLRQRGGKGRGRGRGRGKGKGEPVGVNTASVAYQFADKAMKAGQLAEGEAAALVAEAKAVERTERGAGPRAGQRGSGEVGSRGGQGSRGSRTQGEEKGGSRGVGTGEKAKAVARPETTSTAGGAGDAELPEAGSTGDIEGISTTVDAGGGVLVHLQVLESRERVLQRMRPKYIVLYDPDPAYVRELEVYQAENVGRAVRVYFLVYDQSLEEQKYTSSIKREKDAFEQLILAKAHMSMPALPPPGHRQLALIAETEAPTMLALPGASVNQVTRRAGGRLVPLQSGVRLVVDVREFMSNLPAVLHGSGLEMHPCTLEVGDYVLSPEIVVERKSVSDLFSSFASGRLYNQAEAMTKHYKTAVLLVEFEAEKSFSLQSEQDLGDDIAFNNIISKLALLFLHFPRLRIVWSRSLHDTAAIFRSLKSNQEEPQVQAAMEVGAPIDGRDAAADDACTNQAAVELLRRLPGVTEKNFRAVLTRCDTLADLAAMTPAQLQELLGDARQGKMLHDFLHAQAPTNAQHSA